MPTPIDPARLPSLKAAHERFAEDETASQRQLAELYGVAPSRMTSLINTRFENFPAAQRQPDKSFWYPARAAVASMIAYMEGASAKKIAAAVRHNVAMGHPSATPLPHQGDKTGQSSHPVAQAEPQPLSASELDRLASARTRMWKLQREQGMYVLRTEVARVARGINTLLTRELMGLATVLDPNGELPPAQRTAIERRARNLVVRMNEELAAFLEDDDADAAPRTARTGTGSASAVRRRPARRREADVGAAA